MLRFWFLSRFWGNAEGQKFRSLEVREASSSHLKRKVDNRNSTLWCKYIQGFGKTLFKCATSTSVSIHKTIMNSDKISTNMSRKSRIGIFSIVSAANNIEENSCRKSSVGSFSNISFNNDTEDEDNLRGTYHNAKCHFLTP